MGPAVDGARHSERPGPCRCIGRRRSRAFCGRCAHAVLAGAVCLRLGRFSRSPTARPQLFCRCPFGSRFIVQLCSRSRGASLDASNWGVYVPVVASVFREVGLLCSLWYSTRWLPKRRWRAAALRDLLRFALNFTGARSVAYFNTKIAHFFIFPLLGSAALGYYAIAERLTLTPLTRLATTINRVSFPAFSTIQNDDALLRRGYMQSVQSLLISMGPLLAGVFVFAPEILSLLGKEPARSACASWLATLFKVVGTMVGSMFMAKGRTDWSLYWSLFSVGVLVPSMYLIGIPRGLMGVTGVIAASSLLFLLLSQQLANRLIALPFLEYAGHLLRPISVVSIVFAVLWLTRPLLSGSSSFVLLQGAILGRLTTLFSLRLLAGNCAQATGVACVSRLVQKRVKSLSHPLQSSNSWSMFSTIRSTILEYKGAQDE